MGALGWTVHHPLNRHRRLASALRWAFHNARRRLGPSRDITLRFANNSIEGPIDHPVINLIYYVRGGYYDYDAMTAMSFLLHSGQGFIDVGANIGSYSVLAGNLVGARGRGLLAVEPLHRVGPFLSPPQSLPPPGFERRIGTIPIADEARGTSLIGSGPTTHFLGGPSEASTVTTSTLDAELARTGWSSGGDFAQIDIEGWEPAAVLGATRAAWHRAPRRPDPRSQRTQRGRDHADQRGTMPLPCSMTTTWTSPGRTSRPAPCTCSKNPPRVSPFGDYLVLSPDARRRLERSAGLRPRVAGLARA